MGVKPQDVTVDCKLLTKRLTFCPSKTISYPSWLVSIEQVCSNTEYLLLFPLVARAAFETISKVLIQPIDPELQVVDLRSAILPFERPPITDFDPRKHRDPKNVIKPWMAYFNMLKSCVGAGMLGVPFAVSQAGIILGPCMLIGIGLLIAHTQTTLLWCLNEISRQLQIPHTSYRYGFRLALLHGPPCLHGIGRCGPTLIAVFMVLSQLGICTVFVLLTCDNLRDIMDWNSIVPSLLCLIIPYLILEALMKTLKIVSYVSLFGNFMQFIALSLVFYAICADPHGDVNLVTQRPVSFLLAFGTMMFNMSAVGVILSCEKALKDPKIVTDRYGVIQIGTMVPSLLSCVFGVLGYWSFGSMEENILRSLAYDEIITLVTFSLYLIAVTLAYPIQCYPGIQMVLEVIKNHDPLVTPDNSTMKVIEFLGRPLFVFVTFVIAYYIPLQASFVAFVGNLCTSLLALVFPALMEIGLLYPDYYGRFNHLLIKDFLIVVIGLVMWIFGVMLSGYHLYILILALQSPNSQEFL